MVLCFLKEDDFSIESGRVQNSEEIISGFGAATSRRAEYYSEAILLLALIAFPFILTVN